MESWEGLAEAIFVYSWVQTIFWFSLSFVVNNWISSSCSFYGYVFFSDLLCYQETFPLKKCLKLICILLSMNQRSSLNGQNQICILLDYILYDRILINFSTCPRFSMVFNRFSFSWNRYVDELKTSLFVVFHNSISCLFALISLWVRISAVANAFFFFRWALLVFLQLLLFTYSRDGF